MVKVNKYSKNFEATISLLENAKAAGMVAIRLMVVPTNI